MMAVLIFLSLKIWLCCGKQAGINAVAFLQEIVNVKVDIFAPKQLSFPLMRESIGIVLQLK